MLIQGQTVMTSLINATLPSLEVGYVTKVDYIASTGANLIDLNLQIGDTIGLHINPRFNEGAVVLNSFINGVGEQRKDRLDFH